MTDVRGSWTEVGERIAALGLKLKLHAEEERSARDHGVERACDGVRSQVNEMLDAFGDAARDPAVRDDVRDVVSLFTVALTETLAQARTTVEDAAGRHNRENAS